MNENKLPKIMGVSFTHLSQKDVVEAIAKRITRKDFEKPLIVFTPNVEQVIQTKTDRQFLEDLQAADIRIPDSAGLTYADWWRAAITGRAWLIRERVTGVDTAERLLIEATVRGWKVVVVGGKDGAASLAAENLKKRFDGLKVEGVEVGEISSSRQEPPRQGESWKSYHLTSRTLLQVNQIRPDLVFVGLGAPKQERWVLEHKELLKCQAMMVVGGSDRCLGRLPATSFKFYTKCGFGVVVATDSRTVAVETAIKVSEVWMDGYEQ